jgi:4-amino-4-deoxy-L-arabinose transferase-like glycosyltransferase
MDAEDRRPAIAAIVLALAKLAVHVLTLRPYGFFRDELYYIACSEHLAWGYVDQPPLSIFVLRAWRTLFGDSLSAVRMAPALVGAATVLVTGMIAMRLGGRTLAVVLAELAVLVAGQYLATAHYYSMNVFDALFWTLAVYFCLRALQDRTTTAWIALGATLGLGLLNKTSVLWLGAGLFLGLLLSGREALRTRGPYIAAAIAALLFTPYLVWEMQHGWPTLEFMRNAMAHKYVERSIVRFVLDQVAQNNPATIVLWLIGLIALLRKGREPAAVLGWIYLAAFAIVASQRTAKAEYLSPAYPMLMAAGAVWWEQRLTSAWARRAFVATTVIAMLALGALSAPFALACLALRTALRMSTGPSVIEMLV